MIVSTEHLTDELLQRHYDGELDDADIERVSAHLAGCETCMEREAVLDRLHALITMSAEDRANEMSFDGMFERIEAGIAAGKHGQTQAKTQAQAQAAPSFAKVVSLASYRRVVPAVAAFAVAAAVLLMVTVKPMDKGRVGATPEAPEAEQPEARTTAEANVAPGRSEVLQVDFGSNAGTVFDIAMADGSSTPVVWINDE
jgi:anti-sigma factor RsiW